MLLRAVALLVWLSAVSSAAADESDSAVSVQHLYDKAFQHYSAGEYTEALKLWDEIVRQDPEQKTARQMIKDVSEEIKRKNADRLEAVYAHIRNGRYRSALAGLETLIGDESQVALSPTLQAQLSEVAAIVAQVPEKTKPWKMAALGVNASIGPRQDQKLAYNALRYAQELGPTEARFKKLHDWFLSRHAEFGGSDNVTPGMSLLEYKRFIALDHLYAGKHHLAVGVLDEVLALEPNDLVALKRLGTAYYSLGLHTKAREAWTRALRIAPKDAQLKKFLQKLPGKSARPRQRPQK